jgi:MFS family permease
MPKNSVAPANSVAPGNSVAYAWYVASLLTLLQIVSYFDRYLPTLLVPVIKQDLHLSDFQIGLMLGPAFIVFYITLGIPIGWMADRYSRRGIIAAGVAVWCVMTAMGGVVRSFPLLLASRLGVGVGEATMAPAAISLISDYFPPERRSRAIALFMAAAFFGAGGAFLFFGPLVHSIQGLPPVTVPLLGPVQSWRLCFLLVGLPGLLLVLLMPTVREPARRDKVALSDTGAVTENASLAQAAGYIAQRWQAFGTLFVATTCTVTMSTLGFWHVALFGRNWGWNVAEVGEAVGTILLTVGLAGTLIGTWLSSRWIKAGRPDATLRVLFLGLLISVPCSTLYSEMPSAGLAIGLMCITQLGQAMSTVSGPATLMMLAPSQIRAQATAIYFLIFSIISQFLGPPVVGKITDWFGDPKALRYAISIEAIVVGVPSLLVVWIGFGAARRGVVELQQRLAAEAPAPVLQAAG